jgi:hypothetical protein
VRSYIDNFTSIISALDERKLNCLLKPFHLRLRSRAFSDPGLPPILMKLQVKMRPDRGRDAGKSAERAL